MLQTAARQHLNQRPEKDRSGRIEGEVKTEYPRNSDSGAIRESHEDEEHQAGNPPKDQGSDGEDDAEERNGGPVVPVDADEADLRQQYPKETHGEKSMEDSPCVRGFPRIGQASHHVQADP